MTTQEKKEQKKGKNTQKTETKSRSSTCFMCKQTFEHTENDKTFLLSGEFLCWVCCDTNSLVLESSLHFSTDPWLSDGDFVHHRLTSWLDCAREVVGKPFIIHGAYELEGHSPTGYHPKGMAADGHFKDISLLGAWRKLDGWWPGGLGVYPYWNNPGFHFDIGQKRRWHRDKNGKCHKEMPAMVEGLEV